MSVRGPFFPHGGDGQPPSDAVEIEVVGPSSHSLAPFGGGRASDGTSVSLGGV